MKYTIYAIKDDGYWYVDDDNGFSKDDNLLVAGVPEIVESIVGRLCNRICIEMSDSYFPDSLTVTLQSTSSTGSIYAMTMNGQTMTGWLCPVFFHYFMTAPSVLYITISAA